MSPEDTLDDLTETEQRALVDLARERASEYVDRRSLLKSAGLVGAGAFLGSSFDSGVGQAQAADCTPTATATATPTPTPTPTPTATPTGEASTQTLADWVTNVYTTDGQVYEPTWQGLMAANDHLDASGGGVIYLPTHALFEPDSTLTVGTNVYITGPPVSPIRKRVDSPAWPRVRPLGDTTPFHLTSAGTVRGGLGNLVLDGSNTTSADGVVTSAVAALEHLLIQGFGGAGWRQEGGIDTVARGLELELNDIGWQTGAAVEGPNATKVYSLRCTSNTTYGVEFAGGAGMQIYGATVQGSPTNFKWTGSVAKTLLWGAWSEAWGTYAYDFGAGTAGGNVVHHIGSHLTPSDIRDETGGAPNGIYSVHGRRYFGNGDRGRGFEPIDWSGRRGNFVGDTRLDDGTNTPSGDPALIVWTGSAWRVSGTATRFT